ncbi:MAG: NAD(P)-dependent oxidoreductase [Pirellulales bacterium]
MVKNPVGVIGLGLMGTAITERLLEEGFDVLVHNRTKAKAEPLTERGAIWSDNPLADCDRVIICLYTTEVVAEVLDSMQSALRTGLVLIDTTTGEPKQTASLGQRLAKQSGVSYLDAPISGSSEQTRRGEAVAVVGGERRSFETCSDIFGCIVKKAIHVGPVGSGSKLKLVTNLVLGLNRAALAEGLVFAQSIEVDPDRALKVLLSSAAYSRQMDSKGAKMVNEEFKPQARLAQHLKDVDLILAAANDAGQALPLTQTHQQLLAAAKAANLGDLDNSAIIKAIESFVPDGYPGDGPKSP